MIYCAHCKKLFRRDEFKVSMGEGVLLWDGRRIAYAKHARCGKRTLMLAIAGRLLQTQ